MLRVGGQVVDLGGVGPEVEELGLVDLRVANQLVALVADRARQTGLGKKHGVAHARRFAAPDGGEIRAV